MAARRDGHKVVQIEVGLELVDRLILFDYLDEDSDNNGAIMTAVEELIWRFYCVPEAAPTVRDLSREPTSRTGTLPRNLPPLQRLLAGRPLIRRVRGRNWKKYADDTLIKSHYKTPRRTTSAAQQKD